MSVSSKENFLNIVATEKLTASAIGAMMHFIVNGIMEKDYYELHIPSSRNGEEYDFEANYKNLEEKVEELKDLVVTVKPRMDKGVAKRFIHWISNISPEQDYNLDEFRFSLMKNDREHFNKSLMNRLDVTTMMLEDHFYCLYCVKDDSIRKCCRQPSYIFEINGTTEPVWK